VINRSSRPIATLFGIPLHLHWTALLTALLIAVSAPTAVGISGGAAASFLVGALAVLLFGASLVAHEYAHALMARRRGIGVRRVQMWALGGMAELETEPRRWNDELAVSIVGPLMSLAIGATAVGAALGLSFAGTSVAASLFAWTAVVNIGLAAFNLLPGYPLDGGRVLHSLVWWRTGRRHRATSITAVSGKVIGAGLIAFGAWSFLSGNGGLLTAFVGWFILSAAQQAKAQADEAERLGGIRAGDVARPLPPAVRGDLTVDDFVRYWVPANPTASDVILVTDADQRATGLVPMSAIAAVAPLQAPGLRLDALAIPATSLGVVTPSTDLGDAFAASPSGFILVSEPERLVGFITPIDLRRTLGGRHHPAPGLA